MNLFRLWALVAGYLVAMLFVIHSQSAPTNVVWPVVAGGPAARDIRRSNRSTRATSTSCRWPGATTSVTGRALLKRTRSSSTESWTGIRRLRESLGTQPRGRNSGSSTPALRPGTTASSTIGAAVATSESSRAFASSWTPQRRDRQTGFQVRRRRAHRFPCRPSRWSPGYCGRARASARHL